MAFDPRFRILDLPVELRFTIYAYLSPLCVRHGQIKGAILSCKQLKEEIDKECSKTILKALEDVKKDWEYEGELRIMLPESPRLVDLSNLIVEAPGLTRAALHQEFPRFGLRCTTLTLRLPLTFHLPSLNDARLERLNEAYLMRLAYYLARIMYV
jgi:hypothetical protein